MKKKLITSVCILFIIAISGVGIWYFANVDNHIISSVSSTYPYFNLSDLIKESDIVIKGVVKEQSVPFKIQPANGGEVSIFTDFKIEVENAYRGEKSEIVNLRMQGGEIDNLVVIAEDEPNVVIGSTYIFFLYQPFTGGGYNTEGDYYYLTGGHQALFSQLSKSDYIEEMPLKHLEEVRSESSREKSFFRDDYMYSNVNFDLLKKNNVTLSAELFSGNGYIAISEEVFASEIEMFNEVVPIDSEYWKNQIRDSLAINLKNGFITQEEYDKAMKFNEPYAKIVE